MKTINHNKYLIGATIIAILLMWTSCMRENIHQKGSIVFSVSTTYGNVPSTKTEYSGKDQTNSSISYSSTKERIDWLSSDKIRIACNQAVLLSGDSKYADYTVSPSSSKNDETHGASIAAIGNGLQWNGNGSYNFFAVYPSALQNSDCEISVSDDSAIIHGVIPETQSATLDGHIFKPNMDYAYMYAEAHNVANGGSVQLDFKPLFTALEFTLRTQAGDAITSKLTHVKLSTCYEDECYLAGSFDAEITVDGFSYLDADSITNGSSEITIELPNGGVQLSTSEAYKVTFLALPVDLMGLTLTLCFENGTQRTLDLMENGDWIYVSACCKTYVWNISAPHTIPTFTYTIYANVSEIIVPKAGLTDKTIYITSYKESSSNICTDLYWEEEFSWDGGRTWEYTRPEWFDLSYGPYGSFDNNHTAASYFNSFYENTNNGWTGSLTEISPNPAAAHDLSCHNIYGEMTGGIERVSPYNTANCYVVSAPGWYCFPCVYGNAIKNGLINSNAYTQTGSLSSNIMGQFVNHYNESIDAPWITKGISGNGVDKGAGIYVQSASLLWQDVQSLISNVSYSNDYIYFYVSPQSISQGNAVIAAYEYASSIVWSWHIWVIDNPMSKLAVKTVYNNANTPSSMLTMNLGACEGSVPSRSVLVRYNQFDINGRPTGASCTVAVTQVGETDFYSPSYQWGRKDPLYPVISTGIRTLYDASNNTVALLSQSSPANGYSLSINNPSTFYRDASTNNWVRNIYYNLWNTGINTVGSDNQVTKTIYDPCPPGFMVPNKNVFSGFTTTGNTVNSSQQINAANIATYNNDNGYWFYTNPQDHSEGTIFFPNNGQIAYTGGLYDSVSGYYWTAEPFSADNCSADLFFTQYNNSYYVYPFRNQPRVIGMSVRPIQE